MMNRRNFLRLAVGSGAAAVSWRLWAAPTGGSNSKFVLVFLRGAYDSLSALVPYDEPFYYEARPSIAIARPAPNNLDASVRLDGRWAMHPAMDDALLPLWEAGQLAFVPFSGTGFVSRSHFQAQDWVEFGQAPGERPDGSSGFLNRLLAELGRSSSRQNGVSFTQSLPPVMRGRVQVANSPVKLAGYRAVDAGYENLLLAMYDKHALESLVREGLGLRREISKELQEEMQTASRGALPAGGFALEAERIGRLMHDHPQYSVGFVDIGGWDTHVGQGAARGPLANRLQGVAAGLKAMAEALGPEWQKTTVVVMSEFGRTFRENGSRGTDHGHGSTLWIMGGGLKGGKIVGEQSGLAQKDLHQDRDVPVLNEYREVLGGIFARQYGLDKSALAAVFPGAAPRDFGLL